MNCAQIISGEMHYPRIPRAYWRDRLRMARAMGLNATSTYVFWNLHETEPGFYDFSGDKDVAAYVRTAQEEGLSVILRPGPYVCAEWDFGGLPYWLLRGDAARTIRTANEAYMTPVRRWLARLAAELAPLMARAGGPIVAVQIENEYGAYGCDKTYLSALRSALVDAGLASEAFFTIDQPGDLAAGSLSDVPIAVTFAPGDPQHIFERVREVRPNAAYLVGEYWAGWFDHWGESREPLEAAQQARDLEWMLRQGASVNVYMFHGGTNFGFWNGANDSDTAPYQPTITSYDYEAALDEAGRPTAKYQLFRNAIASVTGEEAPPIPSTGPAVDIPEFTLDFTASLSACAGAPVWSEYPLAMEEIGQGYGFVLYSTVVDGPLDALLQIENVRDYAVVSMDGAVVARFDRRLGTSPVRVATGSPQTRLDILVENCGRINYGRSIASERKGITGRVLLDNRELRGWQIFPISGDPPQSSAFAREPGTAPCFYRGDFNVDEAGDTFVATSTLGKGVLWINGRNAGRFWNIGPQRSLYVPGCWLRGGTNEAIVLDMFQHEAPPRLRGVSVRAH